MSKYDPNNNHSRQTLANALRDMLAEAKFVLRNDGKFEFIHEEVYSFSVDDEVTIFVYSTISNNRVRTVGSDAIRVFATKNDTGWVKTKRINRVGKIGDICDRTLNAMRDVYRAAQKRAA